MEFELKQGLEVLSRTPGVMDALLRGQSEEWLRCRRAPDAFSAVDVIGHLMHAELTDWIPRVRMILEHGDERAFDPFDRFGFQHLISGKGVGELLDEFARLRGESLHALEELGVTGDRLGLRGLHPELGPVTLGQLLATWAVHDLGHIAQVVKTMGNEYRDAVGPWRAYISILA